MGAYTDQGKSVCRAEKRTAMFPRIEIFFAHQAPSIDWPINGLEHAAVIDGFNIIYIVLCINALMLPINIHDH